MKWGLFKASRLLQLAKQYDSKVADAYIKIKKGEFFSAIPGTIINDFTNTITIADKASDTLREFFNIYFDLQDQSMYMFNDFYECFSFLHEVGHIVNNEGCDREAEMKEFHNTTYTNVYDQFKAYREVESESRADAYALNFIKDHKIEIYMLMNDMSKEQATEEVEFWSCL